MIERGEKDEFVRLALPSGRWDLAILVPGNQPGFSSHVAVGDQDLVVPLVQLGRSGRFRARVEDAASHHPVSSWEAFLKNRDSSATPSFFAQRPIAIAPGPLDLSSLPIGSGWEVVIVPAGGYVTKTVPLGILTAATDLAAGAIGIPMGGSLDVEITSPTYSPPEPFVISVRSTSGKHTVASATFDSAKSIHTLFGPLPEGDYEVSVDSVAAALHMKVPALIRQSAVTPVPIRLTPIILGGHVRRGVIDLPYALIEAHGPFGVFLRATSNSSGEYEIPVWASGRYAIAAALPSGGRPALRIVDITGAEDYIPLDLTLGVGLVRGFVSDGSTESPIGDASIEVSVDDRVGHEAFTAITEPDGSFQLDGLGSGNATLTVSAPGYQQATVRNVTADTFELTIKMKQGESVEGHVLDPIGEPVIGALVVLDVSGPDTSAQTWTSSDGDFRFDGISDGPHTLVVHSCGQALAVVNVKNESEGLTVVLQPAIGRVDFAVRNSSGDLANRSGLILQTGGERLTLPFVEAALERCGEGVGSDGSIDLSLLPYGPVLLFDGRNAVLGVFNRFPGEETWLVTLPVAPGTDNPSLTAH